MTRPANDACGTDVDAFLDKAMAIEGAFAAALIDYDSGTTLGLRNKNHHFDVEVAAAGETQIIRSELSMIRQLGLDGDIEDISINLTTQHHILRSLSPGNLFLYLAVDRDAGNLAIARHSLAQIGRELSA